ncbi:MAG: hypothetical protein ACTHV2_12170 [Brachybacterium sp.]|uniref:hypothetical protein n=1 Tax=unclassified Brachybacterium TaxID=2623841 RepID=UPI0026562F5B|nr:type II toxin-antitoxin system HicB family antitoxin [Brevibacterium aurantiacum]
MSKNTDKLGAAMGRSARSSGKGFASSFAEKPVVETVRLAIDLDKDFHRRLKIAAAEHGISQRDLVLNAIKKAYPELREE